MSEQKEEFLAVLGIFAACGCIAALWGFLVPYAINPVHSAVLRCIAAGATVGVGTTVGLAIHYADKQAHTAEQLKRLREQYGSQTTYYDQEIGRLKRQLRARKKLRRE